MKYFRLKNSRQAGFTLIEIILSIVFAAVIGVVFLTYMGTQLTQSSDPVHIARHEGMAEMWMERIIADYVQEMNTPATYTTALANIMARDYTAGIYNMPASVTLTRNYVTYDAAGNETVLTGGATSTNLKVTIGAGGHTVTSILTAQRTTSGDPITYF